MNKKFKSVRFLILVFLYVFSTQAALGNQPHRYLITAASSGIGTAICETLASEGHDLILAGRDEKKLQSLKLKLEQSYHGKYTTKLFDYSVPSSIQNLGEKLKNLPINGIIIIPPRVKITSTDLPSSEEWLDMFKIGFIAPLEILRETLPVLQPESSIVVISGITSVYYMPSYKNFNVLRKMWVAEVKNLVYQLNDREIRVNTISPGHILTDFLRNKVQGRASESHQSFVEQLKNETKDIPLHQYGVPEDVAKATAFLLSKQSKHINGINLVIDGGLSKAY